MIVVIKNNNNKILNNLIFIESYLKLNSFKKN